MVNTYWTDYPELTKSYRTKKEDELSNKIIVLLTEFGDYLKVNKFSKGYFYDLQGGIHLLQNILITIQKRRFNNETQK